MKNKIFFLTLFTLFVSMLWAQTTEIYSYKLSWKGIEKWYAGSTSIPVISFEGAQFPSEDHLPYFNQRMEYDRNFTCQIELINPVYIVLTNEESALIAGHPIPFKSQVETTMQREKGTSYMSISILPFINKNGKLLKLLSFDLQIKKVPIAQKVAGTALHTYATHSVLAQGRFVKIRVRDSGIYKLTFEELNAMGINPSSVRIFGYGGGVLDQNFMADKIDDLPELAILMAKGADGVFGSGDYILFYAQGSVRWSYDATKKMFTHTANTYSDYGYYFVTSDAGTGKQIMDKTIVLPSSPVIHPVEEFVDYQVYEKDLINLANSGKEFYGETFSDVLSYNLPFSFPNPVLTNSTSVRLDVAAAVQANGSAFTLNLNGEQPKILTVPNSNLYDTYEKATGSQAVYSFAPKSDTFTFNLTYDKPTPYSIGYLNYLEVNARRQLKMSGPVMPFRNIDYLGTGSFNKYLLSAGNANTQIWDITDPLNVSRMVTETEDGKMTFVASGNEVNHYVALDPTASQAFQTPEIVGVVPNQDLHGMAQADMVIITHPNFVSQAETLAQAHRQKDNMTVAVVTTDQVYNEFSSGTPDATAYRWVMKMLYDRALLASDTTGLPKYLLLFGRGSYDNRRIRTDSGDNLILTYQADNSLHEVLSYVTDDYFALLDDNEGVQIPSNLLDIGVGRFPVTTTQQATDVVNKTIGYMNNTGKGNWKNQLCFLADDGDQGIHAMQADSVAAITSRTGRGFQVEKIYLDAYQQEVSASGQSYPLARTRLLNSVKSGLFMLNYTGHGFSTGLANERIVLSSDIESMVNSHLSFWVAAACDFMKFDAQTVSGGEQVLLNPVGGGISAFAAARQVYSSQNFMLNKLFNENLFKKVNGEQQRLGDVVRLSKNAMGQELNKLSYIYMGDPAVRLNYPTKYQVITSGINNNTVFGTDTLRALSTNTIHGFIGNDNGNKATGFNGTLHAVMFDKVQRITTLNNDQDQLSYEGPYTFSDRPDTLYAGDIPVVNGEYVFSFKLPSDLHIDLGNGRINYYALDNVNNDEAQGSFENFLVGGSGQLNGIDVVAASANGKLSVSNYPNPAKNQTSFVVNFDRPETITRITFDIFDISGHKICSMNPASLNDFTWDLSNESGQKTKAGIYFYQVKIKTRDRDICSKMNKLIIIY
ncbi:MAG: type IX secretion system sortase PorU [Bacteroidota bacterium]|nr:type IX secretion system sortase PorU [Bacteroidota bacterium]